jgi:hypothetical protein
MSVPNCYTPSHLVIQLHDPKVSCAVKQVEKKGDSPALVLRIKETTDSLRRAEPSSKDVCMLIDLSTKEFWESRYLREIDYSTLLSDVMPKLDIPNFILLDRNFVAMQRSEQKTRLKELCEAVGAVRQEMLKFNFIPGKKLGWAKLLTDKNMSTIELMHEHKLPPGFRLTVIKGTDGMKFSLNIEKPWVLKLFSDFDGSKNNTIDTLVERIQALGPAHKIGRVQYYQSTPSSSNWPLDEDEQSIFPDPKTINELHVKAIGEN